MRWLPCFFFNCLLLAACSSKQPATTAYPSAGQPLSASTADAATQSAALTTPQQFLRWYAPRMDSLNSMCLVPASCNSDTADVYVMDFKRVDNYLAALSKSNFTSARYSANRRAYYHQQADSLRAHPLYDGPPPGMNFDPILYSQDSDDLQALLKQNPVFLRYTPDSARVKINLSYDGTLEKTLVFRLSRQGTRWLIDDIQPVFPSE